jgi:hypothetical protein
MLWACEYCEAQKLLALDHKHCPVCGGAQNPERRYYPAEGDEVAVADHEYAGSDKTCPACEAPNGAKSQFCGGCGSDLEGAKDAKRRSSQSVAEGQSFEGDSAKEAKREHKENKRATEAVRIASISGQKSDAETPKKSGSRKGVGLVMGLLLMMGVLGGGLILCLGAAWLLSKDVAVVATGHSWERTAEVEEYRLVRESAWRDAVPNTGRSLSCTKKKRSEKKVADGKTCKSVRTDQGDGTFKKSEKCTPKYKVVPVMGDKCSYEIERWATVRTEKSNGQDLTGLNWPDVNLARTGNCIGCQREGKRNGRYIVHLEEQGTGTKFTSVCKKEAQWTAVKVGVAYAGKGSLGSSAIQCETLSAQ